MDHDNFHRRSSEYSNTGLEERRMGPPGGGPPMMGPPPIPPKSRGKLYARLLKYPMAVFAIFPSFVTGAGPIVTFVIFGQILNQHTSYAVDGIDTLTDIRNLCLYMVMCAVILGICKFLTIFLWVRIGSRFTNDLRSKLFESLMMSDVEYYDVTSVGSILTLLGEDSQLVQDNFGTTKGTQFQCIGQFLTGIILCYVYCWKLALIATCTIPYAMLVINFMSKCVNSHIMKKFMYTAESITIAEEALAAIRTVKSFNQEDKEFNRFRRLTNKVVHEGILFGRYVSTMMALVMLGVWSAIIGNMYYGGTLVDAGEIKGGDLTSIFGFMMFGTMGVIELQASFQAEQKAISSGARILEMIDHVPNVPFSGGKIIENFQGNIEFRNVSFKYPTRDVYVLKNVSFKIKAGQMGALVGHSGSGKSTCVQLLERFYDVAEGIILLDDEDIKSLDPHWLHTKISLVSQEPVLFQLSIRENIKYSCDDSSDEKAVDAAQKANAAKFIGKLNKKYDFFVGEKGSLLSGGQRQRIAIARALIRDPIILITDEATSALDAGSEKKVQVALDKIMKTCTSVVVAHRLTTIRNADVIYVFESGEIVEVGKHDELVQKQGHYYELVKRQLQENEKKFHSVQSYNIKNVDGVDPQLNEKENKKKKASHLSSSASSSASLSTSSSSSSSNNRNNEPLSDSSVEQESSSQSQNSSVSTVSEESD
ncbi:ATP-binding cassette sub-family B member 8, mitochondrial [Tritrichomonas foetus]|uniref:ATP-binding cassette sub-family B member 8, mitochondrial n=1 Tax=Tritrichomonas foetus TaxID=1144522 RepID=A0A1J4JI66_9EUKA|nr:ATP-binding cassette sub-family B member 8, mitochondrial [Tritrichomonas foetus]|eukprot:OHS97999.1 ATP-binding cassette sub-family B member 8, mitochondrial [Tritrichomonas foetus]